MPPATRSWKLVLLNTTAAVINIAKEAAAAILPAEGRSFYPGHIERL